MTADHVGRPLPSYSRRSPPWMAHSAPTGCLASYFARSGAARVRSMGPADLRRIVHATSSCSNQRVQRPSRVRRQHRNARGSVSQVVVLMGCAMGGHVGAKPTVSVGLTSPGLAWLRSSRPSSRQFSRRRPQPVGRRRLTGSTCSKAGPPDA